MIPKTLARTKNATYAVLIPNPKPEYREFPTPYGTGFFVSEDGYFITARHVLTYEQDATEKFFDPAKLRLTKPDIFPPPQIVGLTLVKEWVKFDLALLKADFAKVKDTNTFKGKNGFGFLEIEFEVPPEGIEVYSFGYPLPKIDVQVNGPLIIGVHYYCPRTTSAVISSHYDVIGPIFVGGFPKCYVIDKALNYGNSGGPLILQENGKVVSVCARFQPVNIGQGAGVSVTIPSLYGITSSLKNIEDFLRNILKT